MNHPARECPTQRPPAANSEADDLRRVASDKRVLATRLNQEAAELERAATRLDVEKRTRQRYYP
jgi:hypothetical protein